MDPRKAMALLGLVALLLSLLSPSTISASLSRSGQRLSASTATPPGQDALDKVEPLVLQELATNGQTQGFALDPLYFLPYAGNPVLPRGAPGTWDTEKYAPEVVWADEVYHLFYTGAEVLGNTPMAIGYATSTNGLSFTRAISTPILAGDRTGFDAYMLVSCAALWEDGTWVLYYDGQDTPVPYPEGTHIGRATATTPTGPWERRDEPVLSPGPPGDWDAASVALASVVRTDDGYVMYYTGGSLPFMQFRDFMIGMATSTDGITWTKYDDPSTVDPPYAASDPVLTMGPDPWETRLVAANDARQTEAGWEMFYCGWPESATSTAIGYATSADGVHWHKYAGNPVFEPQDDPLASVAIDNPAILVEGNTHAMYYTYGWLEGMISLATGTVCMPVVEAVFAWEPPTPTIGQPVTLTAGAAGSDPFTFTWMLDVGSWKEGRVVTHTYDLPGTYTVVLTATNCQAGMVTATQALTVLPPCEPVHDAGFDWVPPDPGIGQVVTFTGWASGTAPIAFGWDFGDGVTGTGQIVTHTYATTGTFPVTMTASNCQTATVSVTHVLTVSEELGCVPVDILTVTTAISGCAVTFGAELSGDPPFAYLWDLGAFGTSTATMPYVDFEAGGTYPYTLTVYNCGMDYWDIYAGEVTVQCEVCQPVTGTDFVWTPVTPTVGQAVTFTGTVVVGDPPVTYTWRLEDGSWKTGLTVTYSYSLPGVYTVMLTATNCQTATDTVAHTLTVTAPPTCTMLEGVTVEGPGSLSAGEAGTYTATYFPLTATAPVVLSWSNGAVGPTAAYSWTLPGTYTVAVTATNPCTVVHGELLVEVSGPVYRVYLPLITRGWETP